MIDLLIITSMLMQYDDTSLNRLNRYVSNKVKFAFNYKEFTDIILTSGDVDDLTKRDHLRMLAKRHTSTVNIELATTIAKDICITSGANYA